MVLMRPSLQLFFEWLKKLCSVFKFSLSSRRNSLTSTSCSDQNAEKIYQETDFLSPEGHLLASSGCILT